MNLNVLLAVPQENNSVQELNSFLSQNNADLYIFPEGFLDNNILQEAIDIIKEKEKYVITGFKDLDSNGQQKALVIDNGKIVDKYTKCILTRREKQKGKRKTEWGENCLRKY